jgi:two-component system response regulator AtoC
VHFGRADGGTLFLDDVGELGPELQARLLRTIQHRELRPVGGSRAVSVDVRIVSTVQRDLDVEMQSGAFREDLYYRLDVIHLHMPPLRERTEDIPQLVEVFARSGDPHHSRRFTADALRHLQSWSWPGNVRELENVVERILVLSQAPFIGPAELRLGVPQARGEAREEALDGGLAEAARSGVTMRELQDRYIERMIAFTGGRKVEAAQRLGIDRKTLYRRQLRKSGS